MTRKAMVGLLAAGCLLAMGFFLGGGTADRLHGLADVVGAPAPADRADQRQAAKSSSRIADQRAITAGNALAEEDDLPASAAWRARETAVAAAPVLRSDDLRDGRHPLATVVRPRAQRAGVGEFNTPGANAAKPAIGSAAARKLDPRIRRLPPVDATQAAEAWRQRDLPQAPIPLYPEVSAPRAREDL